MTKEINLSEILNKHLSACYSVHNIKISDKYQTHLIAAMREVAEKTLELASENANLIGSPVHNNKLSENIVSSIIQINDNTDDFYYEINKQSILNTINQIK